MAIEFIRIANHKHVLSLPGRLMAPQALSAITSVFKRKSKDDNGDELIIARPELSIDIVDPFMSIIWTTPVRGNDCLHRECFDLEAFLLSRTGHNKDAVLMSADQWKCPICRKDARPQSLCVDEFLLEVRRTLEQSNKLDAKAILVKEDGTWEMRLEQQVSKSQARRTRETHTPESGSEATSKVIEPSGPLPVGTAGPSAPATGPIILDDDGD